MDCHFLAQQRRLPTHGLTKLVSSRGSAMPTDTTTSVQGIQQPQQPTHQAAECQSGSTKCRTLQSVPQEVDGLGVSRVNSIRDWRAHQGPRAQTGWCV